MRWNRADTRALLSLGQGAPVAVVATHPPYLCPPWLMAKTPNTAIPKKLAVMAMANKNFIIVLVYLFRALRENTDMPIDVRLIALHVHHFPLPVEEH